MLKPRHNRKIAFVPKVNKTKAASNKKKRIKFLSSRTLQLKEGCKFSSATTPIEIPKKCNEG